MPLVKGLTRTTTKHHIGKKMNMLAQTFQLKFSSVGIIHEHVVLGHERRFRISGAARLITTTQNYILITLPTFDYTWNSPELELKSKLN